MDSASTNLPAHSTGQLIFFLPNSALLSSWGLSLLSTLLKCAFPQGQKLPLSSARWTQHPTSDTLTIPFLVKMGIPQHKVSDSWVGDICFSVFLLSSISKVPETARITLFRSLLKAIRTKPTWYQEVMTSHKVISLSLTFVYKAILHSKHVVLFF